MNMIWLRNDVNTLAITFKCGIMDAALVVLYKLD